MFCKEAPPLTKCRLNQLKSRGEMADHDKTDLEWDAHCQRLGFAAPPALNLKPQSWVPTGGYDLAESAKRAPNPPIGLSKSTARPPPFPPPAPPSPKDNVMGDGGDLADDEGGGEELHGGEEEGRCKFEWERSWPEDYYEEEAMEEWAYGEGDDPQVASVPTLAGSSVVKYDPTGAQKGVPKMMPTQHPPLMQTLPPPQEGVVTMSTEAWQRLNALAKPLPKSDESDSAGPQDRRLRQSMFMQGQSRLHLP